MICKSGGTIGKGLKLCINKCSVSEVCKHCDRDKETAEDNLSVHPVKGKGFKGVISVIQVHGNKLDDEKDSAKYEGIYIEI